MMTLMPASCARLSTGSSAFAVVRNDADHVDLLGDQILDRAHLLRGVVGRRIDHGGVDAEVLAGLLNALLDIVEPGNPHLADDADLQGVVGGDELDLASARWRRQGRLRPEESCDGSYCAFSPSSHDKAVNQPLSLSRTVLESGQTTFFIASCRRRVNAARDQRTRHPLRRRMRPIRAKSSPCLNRSQVAGHRDCSRFRCRSGEGGGGAVSRPALVFRC